MGKCTITFEDNGNSIDTRIAFDPPLKKTPGSLDDFKPSPAQVLGAQICKEVFALLENSADEAGIETEDI